MGFFIQMLLEIWNEHLMKSNGESQLLTVLMFQAQLEENNKFPIDQPLIH